MANARVLRLRRYSPAERGTDQNYAGAGKRKPIDHRASRSRTAWAI
jgi:hypothetical protein